MFLVLNKNKILSILVLSTIVITCVSLYMNATIQTSGVSGKRLLPIYNVETEEKKVAITLNCAWDDSDIESILNTLDDYNVKLTFFMVGEWVDKYPESLKKIHNSGHEIANHSDGHKHVNKLDLQENIEEIQNCSNKIKEVIGIGTNLYRGPYGEYNNTVIEAANATKHQTIQWNIDSLDYKGLTKEEMWNRIEKKIQPGSIILMHSGAENTADALPYIIEKLINMKYEIVKVSDLIIKEDSYIDINGMQKKVNNI